MVATGVRPARRGRPGHSLDSLLDIAAAAFNERGYEATSMEELAGRLGVSVLEATNDERSVLANAECAFIVDGIGNLLRADGGEVR